jgi:hypothetical protein
MRKWIYGVLLSGFLLVGYAASNILTSSPESENPTVAFQLTATEDALLLHTETMIAAQTSHALGTPNAFELTATDLIRTATEGVSYQLTTTQYASSLYPPTATSDKYQSMATQIIADATGTAVALQNNDCITVERNVWDINEAIADIATRTVKVFADSYIIDAWVCNNELVQSRPLGDYAINLVTFEEIITPDVAAELIERAIELLIAYPPEATMLSPITIQVFAPPHIPILEISADTFILDAEFTYEAAMTTYESGLRGQALLDALDIVVSE